jgi:uncharacterized membrane protein YadS
MQPGMAFCVRTVLSWAVALLGLRVGLADIALGSDEFHDDDADERKRYL